MSKSSKERITTRPAGMLLSRVSLLFLLACLLLAAWFDQVVIVIVLALLLVAAGLSMLWSRYSLSGVSCERLLSERRVFPGENFELQLRLFNRKLLPLPWIQLDDELPDGFTPDNALVPYDRPGYGLLSRTASLLWYTSVSWQQRLCGHRRGYYPLGPVTVTSGDIFGFYPRSLTTSLVDHVIVYPKIFPIARLGIPPLYPIGDTTAERRIFQDPVRVIGVRDYTPHDSLRHIHWKASARHQDLQVKVFEPTTTQTTALFLAVDSFRHERPVPEELTDGETAPDVFDEELFELGISAAASVAAHLVEHRSSVGLYVNSRLADSAQPAQIMPGSTTGQLVGILEALAKVTADPSGPFEDFLQVERAGLPWGTTLVIILSGHSPALRELLADLRESGHRLMVLQVGAPSEGAFEQAVDWHTIVQPADFTRIAAEAIA